VTLRAQTLTLRVSHRQFTGAGFYTHFDVSSDCPLVTRDLTWGDIS
jgi:hypothetical protein